jgi:azurin
MRTMLFALALLAPLAAATAGCGKDDKPTGAAPGPPSVAPPPVASEAPKPAPTASVAEKTAPHVEIQMASVANEMRFDKAALTVPASAEVHLTLKNNATMSTLPHNWVLVKTGTEASVAAAGLKRGDPAGYIDVMDRDMLAFTPLAKPGETAEVTFTAPSEAGTYPYICTMPGHYMLMKGLLTVTP